MAEYIEREAAIEKLNEHLYAMIDDAPISQGTKDIYEMAYRHVEDVLRKAIPAADVVEEENILKFYYVRSIDEYWIGQRIDNFYYAEYDPKSRQWVWTHSRYLPWGEHIVSPTSLWKEHTYPSEPEEIPFAEWLQGFIKKHAADVVEVMHGRWISVAADVRFRCSLCDCEVSASWDYDQDGMFDYCPCCGAKMDGERKGGTSE